VDPKLDFPALALGFVTHLDVFWDHPPFLRLVDRLASFFASQV
jgi:hypothetical protein